MTTGETPAPTAGRGGTSIPRGQRLLPASWQGPGRSAAWRRARARRVLAVVLVAAAALIGLSVVRPAPEPTEAVLVAARDLAPGQAVSAGDVTVQQWPRSVAAQLNSLTAQTASGRTLATALRRGEVVSSSRVVSAASLPSGRGESALTVPTDDATLALARTGDRIDVYAADGRRVGAALQVLGVHRPESSGTGLGIGGGRTGGTLTVAVPPTQASALTAALAGGGTGSGQVVVTVNGAPNPR